MSDLDLSQELATWPTRLEAACVGTRFSSMHVVQTCGSTQDVAATLPIGSVVVAGRQDAGRGRLGRSWSDGHGSSVSVSFVVKPMQAPRLSTATVLAVFDAITAIGVSVEKVGVKFPNDVLARDGGKLAGILVEGNAERMIIGIGVNVTPLPSDSNWRSLQELGVDRPRLEVLEALLPALEKRLECDEERLRLDFASRDLLLGHAVVLKHDQSHVAGTLRACNPFGTLDIEMEEDLLTIPAEQCTLVQWSIGE